MLDPTCPPEGHPSRTCACPKLRCPRRGPQGTRPIAPHAWPGKDKHSERLRCQAWGQECSARQRRHRARGWLVGALDNVVLSPPRLRQLDRRHTPAMTIGVAGQVWSDQDDRWSPVHPAPCGRQRMQPRVKDLLGPALEAG
jgi:hypothetical protein